MADDDRNKAQQLLQTIKQWMLKNILLLLIIAAVVLGLTVGLTARLLKPSVWVVSHWVESLLFTIHILLFQIWAVEFPGNVSLKINSFFE